MDPRGSKQYNRMQPPPPPPNAQGPQNGCFPGQVFQEILKEIVPDASFSADSLKLLDWMTAFITSNYMYRLKRSPVITEELILSVSDFIAARLNQGVDKVPLPPEMPLNSGMGQYNQIQMQTMPQMNQMPYGMQPNQMPMCQMGYGMQMNQVQMPQNQYGMPMQQPMPQVNQRHSQRLNAIKRFKESQENQ
ncbi:hypothetical protein TVAG_206360 [Trichomonas vaginalis G3]|uniref:Uncharacterized protein n=1 Tax=Trichomonas vaginalis (strain ATCC PRA-98 / G3) TaxID=412133 RepID=A2E1M1_TRIV3|nr:hypothetical protein TVAGG3_0519090 [Trichomonas vaginalis G3]EAY13468.1 hypothetical protein TVAG_206360 [Trichomonas vaginalis G3]KAI5518337.1 hypothetical protein TVAGG3_0519090 [Trichomonas vaginalis G3]|eukprot:XP_001325691.1 hypothetical protein [Trichomonas vaginalis G3]